MAHYNVFGLQLSSFHGIYHSIQATADYIAAGVICMSLTCMAFFP